MRLQATHLNSCLFLNQKGLKAEKVPAVCMTFATYFTDSASPHPCGNDCLQYEGLNDQQIQTVLDAAQKNLPGAKINWSVAWLKLISGHFWASLNYEFVVFPIFFLPVDGLVYKTFTIPAIRFRLSIQCFLKRTCSESRRYVSHDMTYSCNEDPNASEVYKIICSRATWASKQHV